MFARFIIVAIVVGLAVAKPQWHQLESYTFEKYLTDYNLKYSSKDMEMRREIFNKELARVKAHNAKNASWKEGINKFSVMTAAERQSAFGRHKGVAHHQQLKNAKTMPADFKMKSVSELPANVDWRIKGIVSAVKDQGHCGSCWAFASTATIESYVALASGLLFDLSTEQMAMCAPNPNACGGTGKCEGSTAELAFEYLSGSTGMYQEYQYPYTSYYGTDYDCKLPSTDSTQPVATIDGYVKLANNDYTSVMNAIASIGPLAINVDASTWHAYEGGIFNGCNQTTPDVNHVVVMVGYGEDESGKYWLVRNSWSASWGEAGYIKLARADSQAEEKCGMDVTPQDGVECSGSDAPVEVCGTCGAIYDTSFPLNAIAF